MQLENKVCLITGATRGIGFSIAKTFLKNGANVIIWGSRQETIDHAFDQLMELGFDQDKILVQAPNLLDPQSMQQAIDQILMRYKKIDVLVNNAGISSHASIFDTSYEDFSKELALNLTAPFYLIKLVANVMKQNGGGSIINTSSLVAKYGSVNQVSYVSSKSGINGLTIAAARELGKYNIRVNAVAPGVIETDMVKQLVDEDTKNALTKLTPLQRIGQVDEIVGAYLYLASDDSSYTTGSIIDVNGGIVK